ncbi:MAG TPA: hypothetical protein PLP62_13855 [Flavobacteriaceae bacterium]|nr:hypothetical protein [Alteromonas sp.]HPF12534.1 hypothetical protein [Flavobacteriaceae bacterium]HQU66359.1 hypothetical protein [Flavobacteriaceae bacterium]HRW44986.1 hypothetical protein [Flavobacteriaceae bacterium]
MKWNIGLNERQEILTFALLLENFSSIFLSGLLGIKDYRDTKSFGNTNISLSFNQKINLLIDIGALDSNERNKFLTFMEIRNQFMHNLAADSYESCYAFLKGKEKFILDNYPQETTLTKEEQLKKATVELADDILKKTIDLIDKVKEKIEKEVKTELLEKMQPILLKKIEEMSTKK